MKAAASMARQASACSRTESSAMGRDFGEIAQGEIDGGEKAERGLGGNWLLRAAERDDPTHRHTHADSDRRSVCGPRFRSG